MGILLVVAFLVALNQNGALLGSKGLLPVPLYLRHVKQHLGISYYVTLCGYHGDIGGNAASNWSLFSAIPTLLWWIDDKDIDRGLDVIAWCGLLLSAVTIVMGSCNVIISSLLWLLYHSLVNVGQRW